jgi:hypothetical protein
MVRYWIHSLRFVIPLKSIFRAILHDPNVYSNPLTFNPERFLKDGQLDKSIRDPTVAFFGFGRRICPGRFLSQHSMFILISHILTVYNIRPALDKDGNEIEIIPTMTNGFISYVHLMLQLFNRDLTMQTTVTQSLSNAGSYRVQGRLKI